MNPSRKLLTAVLVAMQLTGGIAAAESATESTAEAETRAEPAVKKSRAGICHVRGTPGYVQTRRHEAFQSLERCLASGGRLIKGANVPGVPPEESSPDLAVFDSEDPRFVRRSRGGICYGSNDGTYLQLLYFRAYRSMQDCLDSGGRTPGESATTRD